MINTINILKISALTFLLTLAISCGHKHGPGDGHDHGDTNTTHSEDDGHNHGSEGEDHHEEGLHLTMEQAKTVGLEFGDFSTIKVNDYIKATGTLDLPPNAYSSVTSKFNGVINGTKKFVEGEYIKKGTIIAYLENPEFLVKQQEYLIVQAELKLKKLDLDRQKGLVNANAGVAKTLQNVETEVAVLEAKSVGLSKQLNYFGISTNDLTPSSMVQQIAIFAPMGGYISSINFHNGVYVQSSMTLMEIISSEHLHLELDIFEKDISQIKLDQKISYTIPAFGTTIYDGEVSVIGKEFNNDTKTVRVHGHLDGTKPQFLKGLFINAKIWLNDISTTALPEKAIIQDGKKTFIYVAVNDKEAKEIEFTEIQVITKATDNGFTAVKLMDEIPEGMQIITKGAYYIYAQSKAGELAHEH